MATTGLAFSGGGIRSAAFCSGVLRRMLQRKVKVNYLSCVSGGGYTGTAYLDWKYRNEQEDNPKWHKEFFDHMRKRAGIFCDWQRPIIGIFEFLITFALIATVSVIFPAIVWMSYCCPVAYAIDFLVGDILRAKPVCPEGYTFTNTTDIHGHIDEPCSELPGKNAFRRIVMFSSLFAIGVVSFMFERCSPWGKALFKFLSTSALVLFALLALPWAIHDFLESTPMLVQAMILVLAALVWISFPVLRRQASLVMVIYLYAFVTHTRVYKHQFLGFEYSVYSFDLAVWVSGLVLWLVPWIGSIQQRLVHVFNRWRLQGAFYTRASRGITGCSGIGCDDVCIGCPKSVEGEDKSFGALNLADLEDVSPMYICNTTVNSWKRTPDDEYPFEILTLTPREIRRLDSPFDEDVFMNKLEPNHIMLSEAMAMSAAAVSQRMGKMDVDQEEFTDLKIILGIAMGASILSTQARHRGKGNLLVAVSFFIETLRVLPLVGFPIVFLFIGGDEKWMTIGVFTYFLFILIYSLVALIPTGAAKPGVLEKIARWFLVQVPYTRFVRNMMGIVNVGPSPPPILRISDGGHLENFGLLPLLQMRLSRIVVVNGGHCVSDAAYGEDLLVALEMARKKLKCSFVGIHGRDILEDLRANFVDKKPGEQTRSYKLKVAYYDSDRDDGTEKRVGEGEILLIAPRHPNKGVQTEQPMTWKEALHDIDTDLEAGQWGTGPVLTAEEADRLTFGCCEFCHCLACKTASHYCCDTFPLHSTANQFFTPAMFSSYHREGYRACVEAEAAEFLQQ